MRLVDDWRRILRRAWSVWLSALAGCTELLTIVAPLLMGVDLPLWMNLVVLGLVLSSIAARLIDQGIAKPKTVSSDETETGV